MLQRISLLILISSITLPCSAQTWNNSSGGNWNQTGNWLPASVPNGFGTIATLGSSITSSSVITLDGTATPGNLIYSAATSSYTIAAGANDTLTLPGTSSNGPRIVVNSNVTANQFISANVASGTGTTGLQIINDLGSGRFLELSGNITAPGASGAVTFSGAGETRVSGVITSNTLQQSATRLILSGPTMTVTNVKVNAGELSLTSSNVLANSIVDFTVATNATILTNGLDQTIQTLTDSSSTGAFAHTINTGTNPSSTLTLGGSFAFNTTFKGDIRGQSNVVKAGPGTLTLNQIASSIKSSYTGTTTVRAGTLIVEDTLRTNVDGPLGNSASAILIGDAGTLSTDNATFYYRSTTTIPALQRPITIQAGLGQRTIGSNRTDSSEVYFGNTITLNKDANLNALTGPVSFQAAIVGTGGVTKIGNGTVRALGTNTYSGPTLLHEGALQLVGANATAVNTPYAIISGGFLTQRLILDNTNGSNADRLGNIPIHLTGGELALIGRNTANDTESIDLVNLHLGHSYVRITPGTTSGSAMLTANTGIVRQNRSLLSIRGSTQLGAGGANDSRFYAGNGASLPTLGGGGAFGSTNISIIPFVFTDPDGGGSSNPSVYGFVSYDAAVGFRALQSSEYVNSLSAVGTLNNVRLLGSDTISSNQTINSLHFAPTTTGTISLNNGATLNLNSGSFISSAGTLTVNGGQIAFGANEGVIVTHLLNASTTINSNLTGANGLTISLQGNNTLNLNGANQNLSGPISIATSFAGTVAFNTPAALGSAIDPINIISDYEASLRHTGSVSATLSKPIDFVSTSVVDSDSFYASRRALSISQANNVSLTLAGAITGNGNLRLLGNGPILLRGNNTFTGQLYINAPSVSILGNAQLGNSTNQLYFENAATTLHHDGTTTWDSNHPVTLFASNIKVDSNGQNINWHGKLEILPTSTLTKQGNGTLRIDGEISAFNGSFIAEAGRLEIIPASGSFLRNATVRSGATLVSNGVFSNQITIDAGGRIAPGASAGTLTTAILSLGTGTPIQYDWEAGSITQDKIVVTSSALNLTNVQLTFNLIDAGLGGAVLPTDLFPLITVTGSNSITGFNPLLMQVNFISTPQWEIGTYNLQILPDNGNTTLFLTGLTAVPEPGTWALIAGSSLAASLGIYHWRRKFWSILQKEIVQEEIEL